MVYYKYKKEKLEEKFSESKVFLVKIRECIKRNPDGEDDIIDEAMISYLLSLEIDTLMIIIKESYQKKEL